MKGEENTRFQGVLSPSHWSANRDTRETDFTSQFPKVGFLPARLEFGRRHESRGETENDTALRPPKRQREHRSSMIPTAKRGEQRPRLSSSRIEKSPELLCSSRVSDNYPRYGNRAARSGRMNRKRGKQTVIHDGARQRYSPNSALEPSSITANSGGLRRVGYRSMFGTPSGWKASSRYTSSARRWPHSSWRRGQQRDAQSCRPCPGIAVVDARPRWTSSARLGEQVAHTTAMRTRRPEQLGRIARYRMVKTGHIGDYPYGDDAPYLAANPLKKVSRAPAEHTSERNVGQNTGDPDLALGNLPITGDTTAPPEGLAHSARTPRMEAVHRPITALRGARKGWRKRRFRRNGRLSATS